MNYMLLFLILNLAFLLSLNAKPKIYLIETADEHDDNSINTYAEDDGTENVNKSENSIEADNSSEIMSKKRRSGKGSKDGYGFDPLVPSSEGICKSTPSSPGCESTSTAPDDGESTPPAQESTPQVRVIKKCDAEVGPQPSPQPINDTTGVACLKEDKINYWGHDISTKISEGVDDCANICGVTQNCNFWSFNKVENRCWIKTRNTNRGDEKDTISGTKNCAKELVPQGQPQHQDAKADLGDACLKEDNINYWGYDITTKISEGVDDCAKFCGQIEECNFWTMNKPNNRCWIKTHDTNRRDHKDSISGTKNCAIALAQQVQPQSQRTKVDIGGACSKEDNIDYWGYDIANRISEGVDDCANFCGKMQDCNFWTLNKLNNRCWIKTNNTNRLKENNSISGTKNCATELVPQVQPQPQHTKADLGDACLKEDNINYWGHDISSKISEGADDCANFCGVTQGCNFWSLNKSKKRCWIKTRNTNRGDDKDTISGTKNCAKVQPQSQNATADLGDGDDALCVSATTPTVPTPDVPVEVLRTTPGATNEWSTRVPRTTPGSTNEWSTRVIRTTPGAANEWSTRVPRTTPGTANEWSTRVTPTAPGGGYGSTEEVSGEVTPVAPDDGEVTPATQDGGYASTEEVSGEVNPVAPGDGEVTPPATDGEHASSEEVSGEITPVAPGYGEVTPSAQGGEYTSTEEVSGEITPVASDGGHASAEGGGYTSTKEVSGEVTPVAPVDGYVSTEEVSGEVTPVAPGDGEVTPASPDGGYASTEDVSGEDVSASAE